MHDPAAAVDPEQFDSVSGPATELAPDSVAADPNRTQHKSWQWLFWIIVTIAILIVVLFGDFVPSNRPSWQAVIFFAAVVLLCCLLGAYAGFGKQPFRWIMIAVFPPGIGWFVNLILGESSLLEFEIFFCGIAGVMTVVTLILRKFAGDLKLVTIGENTVDALQFGIKDLLIWTTSVAVLIAVGQKILSMEGSANNSRISFVILAIAACLAIATVVNIWALFGRKITPLKCLVVVAITLFSVALNYLLVPFNDWFFATIAFVNQVLVVIVIITLRKQGYRFVKRTV